MIFRKADLRHLKWPLLALPITLCLGSISIVASNDFTANAQNERQTAQRRLNAARTSLATAEEDLNNMETYTSEYTELIKHGVIGEQQRLDWIEDMEKIRRQHRVLNFNYAISMQHPYRLESKVDQGHLEPRVSDITLQLDLLHEGQLMNFLDKLHTDTRGKFILHTCSITRVYDTDTTKGLKASCSGEWMTLTIDDPA